MKHPRTTFLWILSFRPNIAYSWHQPSTPRPFSSALQSTRKEILALSGGLATNLLSNVASASTGSLTRQPSFESISWDAPKQRDLNTERMSDAINDGIKERGWLVTGIGQPELFDDAFFSLENGKKKLRGYKAYCRRQRQRFTTDLRCELVCCSVTAPNTITLLWRRQSKEQAQLISTVLKTSPTDGLVVSQVDQVQSNAAASLEVLQSRCNWYTCTLRDV